MSMLCNPTRFVKKEEVKHKWYVVDATDKPLGRLASKIAHILMGKHKPEYTPNVDCGDYVIVVNASKVKITGKKLNQRMVYRHSGYPGGLKARPYAYYMQKYPHKLIEKVVWGMMPHTKLGRKMFKKLKVYDGPEHPHKAQKPEPLDI